MTRETTGSEIAIVGCAGRFPGAPDLEAFWRNLAAGVESIAFLTPEELRAAGVPEELVRNPAYVPACGVMPDPESFDAGLFGMSPREARATDPQHRLLLECAWEALEDAGCDPARFPGLIGVFAGTSLSRYMLAAHAAPDLGPTLDPYQLAVGNDKDYLATRVSYKLGLEGPAFTVQTACSTSLVAVHLACQSLLNGECDLALAGGVSAPFPQETGYLWTEGMVVSPDGHTRAFDERGQGTVAGRGVGMVVLRRLEDAISANTAGDAVRAVILGSAINNDGSRKVGFTAPRIEGQARAIRAAQVVAELDDARRVSYVEAHGTGTPLGDPIEIAALTRAFRATTSDTAFCAVGSVKTNIGHLDAAAGVAGLIKTVLALEHRQIPPSLHCETLNPKIDFAGSPFFVNRELRAWPAGDGEPRRAGVSSFGIGGTNAHAVVEEAPEREPSGPARRHQLLILSARTATALDAAAGRLAAYLERQQDPLADTAFTLRMGRRELEHRRAVVCTDRGSAISALRTPSRIEAPPADTTAAAAFLFPGLGGQHPGMASGLLSEEPLFRKEIEACAEVLRPLLGFDPMRLFGTGFPEAGELLGDIAVSMPVLFALEQSLGRLWMSWGVTPKALLGHSLGEYAAACLAGVFSTGDGLRIMAARGRLLAELPPGGMISVPLSEEECAPLLVPGQLWLATINGPRTCVLSGTPEALDEVESRLAAEGRTARRVRARGAYHSGMIDAPMLERFRAEVARVRLAEPSIPFLSNLTGTWIQAGQATDPDYWTEHLRSPVRFADDLAELLRDPGIVPVELGPGRTLATLAAERLGSMGGSRPALTSLRHPQETAEDAAVLYASLGRLWAEGVPVDWSRFAADERRLRVRLPTYPFERQLYTVPRQVTMKAGQEAPEDRFQVPVWKQTPPLEPSRKPGGPWLVFTTGADPIPARLEARGDAVARVEIGERFRRLGTGRYALDPGRPGEYDELLAALDEDGFASAGVIHAWCLGGLAEPAALEERLSRAETATALGFHSLLSLAQASGRRGGPLRLTVLSEGLHRIAGETSPAPERATLLGPVLVIPREMPGAVCRSVDLDRSPDLDALLAELDSGEAPVVALRDGARWVPGFEPVRLDASTETRLREGGTYLITGGLGAMGLAFAERFARQARVKLALLSRNAETTDRVRRIEALGSEVMVVRADAADPDSMAAAVAAVRERFGPIHGAIHAAGILGTGLLQGRTREAADAVLDPKVRGALILDHLLRGEPLDFLVLCSSLSALSGAAGQVDYCAANAFLDAFARWRGRPFVAVDWDRWKGAGMAHAAASRQEVHPLLGVRLDAGPERAVFAAGLGAAGSWVLDEHRLLGRPVLPGTAYLEMARAACEAVAGAGPVEIADVLFWTPLVVPADQEAEVYTVLDRRPDGSFVFEVLSFAFGGFRRHATGSVRRLDEAAAAAARERAGRVRERFAMLETAPAQEPGPEALAAAFGPRWQCLRRYRFVDGEGLADISLDEAQAGDVSTWRLHPALLDAATGFTSANLTEGHLPLSYRTVRVLAPLPAAVRSWGRGHSSGTTFSADVVVTGIDGEPLVEIEEFTKRRLEAHQGEADLADLESGGDRSAVDPGFDPEAGMLPHEGAEALVRILGSRRRLSQVAVSAPIRKRTAPAVRQGRPSAPVPPVADAGVEETLRRLWSEALGVAEVGLHDNFFALGGDSILGLQVVARAREAGLELAPGQIFEHQTVAQLAAVLGGGKPPAAEETPAALTPGEDVYPLTPLQEGMLFHTLGAPGSGVYIERLACELRGGLDPAAFRRAWEEILARHPVLRTAFLWQGLDRPMQVVRGTVRLPWQEEDWRGLSEEDREARLTAYLDDDLRRGFDVARAPLMRIALFRTGERAWRLVWTHHHLLLDGWARAHVMTDVLTFYATARHGTPVRPFRDYVAWLKGPGAQDLQGAEAFWRRTLAGFASPTPLGFSTGPADGQEDTDLALTAAGTTALQERARRERITLNTLVQGAWAVLLARLSGEEDVVYGNVVSGRPASLPGSEAMVGPFINTLPVRARLRPTEPAAGWLRRFQEELAAQRRYEHTPLVQVQALSEVPRGTPLFETLVVFENHPGGGVGQSLLDLEIGDLRYDSKAHYPLSLVAFPGESLRLQLKHERARVDGMTAGRLLARLGTLLNALAADADRPLSELPYLPEAERREALARAGTLRPTAPDSLTIHGLFAERAAATPDAIAVEHDGAVLTYGELEHRAERLARRLRAMGIRPGTVVGLEVERSPELIVGMLAILKAGAAYLPLDPSHPAERRQALLADAGAPFMLTREDVLGEGGGALSRAAGEGRGGGFSNAETLAYVIYTSGSTGRPKGVAVSHRAVLHLLLDTDYVRLEPDDIVAQVATPAFDAATFEIWGPLLAGARLSILGRYESLHPPDFAARLRERGVTTLFLTTALFNAMAREAPAAFAGLRHVLFGGEAVDPGAVRAILNGGPPQRLLHVYGPTEATTFSTWHLVRDVSGTVPIGGPIAGTRALILDLWGGLAPAGVAGELYLGGDGLARGYLGRPDLTAERFVPDPTEPGRLYRTGDLVRRADAGIEFLGRTDHQVKVRGFRIEPGEVEAALREHPAVRDAIVAALPDPNGGRRLVAWWVRRPESGETDLRADLRSRLPEPMVPSAFVEMDELPLNASGKVDRSRLPEPEAVVRTDQAGAPLTPVQELLAATVAAILGRERIDVRDSFLGLGGHSLMATQVVSRVREAFGVDLPLAAVFEEPTLADLAGRIESLLRADAGTELPPLAPAPRDASLPLSWSQERLWILDQLEPGLAAYNIPLSARLEGSLDVQALRSSLGEIVRRHEALRTRFTVRGGSPVQEIRPFEGLDLPVVDVGDETEAMTIARREAARPFDLERDSLIRAVLLRLSETDHVLMVNLHHIVSDGWSTGVLLRELSALYPAFLDGRPSPLPLLPIQYADFAAWQRGWLRGEALERELAFWRRALDGVPELDLPTDRPRRSVTSFDGGLRTAALGPDLARGVASLCQAAKVTPFMVLLAAWELLLARYAGQEDFAVGVPVANRDRIETEGLIGFFVNTIVIRTSPAGTVLETLKKVRETALAAFAHRDMPFQKLVEELRPRRSQQLSPFFQVFFALQNAPMPPLTLPGLTLSAFPMDTGTAKFELSLSLVEDADGYLASLEHSRDLFDGDTAGRLLRHYAVLLDGLAAVPERPVAELPLLSVAERHQILVTWNDTERPGAAGMLVHRLFEEVAAANPDSVALLRGDDRITYGELNRKADRLAHRLRGLGVGPEVPVGVFLDSSPELIVAYLAALKAGGAYLPLVPSYPKDRLEFMLEETGAPVVLTRQVLSGQLEGLKAMVLALDEEVLEDGSNLPALVESGSSLAYVMYTSGSTGRPKGVAVNHEGIVRLVRDSGFADLGPDQTFLQITAISFDVSTFEIWGALLNGGRLAFLQGPTLGLEEIGEAIARHGVTTLWLSSGLFSVMVDRHLDDLRPLRQLLAGGDVVPLPQARRVLEEIPGCRLIDGYGPTENTTFTACSTVTREDVERPSIPIGRPLNNTTVYVLDADLQPVPIGVRGGLYTGGLGLARGYFGRPGLTAEAFVPHPFGKPGERLYDTGDVARWLPDGTGGILEFLGRRDTQVKVRGFRIEPGEIEAALAGHAAVTEAVVVAREDRPGDRRLAAYLVPAPGAEPSAAELQEHLRRSLPDYMIPSVFVVLEALPLNRSGKVDRRALPAPEGVDRGAQANYVPPRTEMEERIARVWREVLDVERVGVHDSFFDLGGHSLLLLQVVGRLQEALGRDLPKGLMFEHPTIASLAAALGAPATPTTSPAPALEHSQDRAAARRESLRQRQRPTR